MGKGKKAGKRAWILNMKKAWKILEKTFTDGIFAQKVGGIDEKRAFKNSGHKK